MTVKDLFSACDSALLTKCFCEADGIIDAESAEHLCQRLDKLVPVFSEENIILGTKYVSFDEELPAGIGVTVYKKSDIAENFRELSVNSGNTLTENEAVELSDMIDGIGGHSAELMSWCEIFGCEIDEDNARSLGKERLMAEIMCAMTCYGYSEAEIDRARAKTGASTTDNDGISLDKMAMLLFGGELPQNDEPLFSAETVANMVNTYNVLSGYYEKVLKHH